MDFNFNRLRGRIVEKYGTCDRFAAAMGLAKGAMSARLNNVTPWKANEIRTAANLLDIPAEEISAYFLTPKF